MTDGYLTKGKRVRVQYFKSRPVPLSGHQIKFEAEWIDVTGEVTYVQGDHPTAPKLVEIFIKSDEDGAEIGPVDIRHIVEMDGVAIKVKGV